MDISVSTASHQPRRRSALFSGSPSQDVSWRHFATSRAWMMRQGYGMRTVAALAVYSYVLLLAGKWIGTGSNEGRVATGRFSPGHGGGVVDGHHGPIDAVYTWVNGSDEVWLREMSKWKQRLGLEALASNVTEVSSANRFRENDELRYSIRSLRMHAPWIRHIFIVTNGQVPSWLNVSHPGVSVVTHSQIFPDRADLPTFSSNAIETNLHRIPGLAPRWIYFNDDIFLVQPVFPSDWVILSSQDRTTYKIYLTWPVPTCSEGCVESWIGDGTCDISCNVTACGFDGGDCHGVSGLASSMDWMEECAQECLHGLIGNGECDDECDSEQCAFDGGECLEDPSTADMLYGIVLEPPETGKSTKSNISAVMSVQSDMSSMFVDVTSLISGPITSVELNSSFVLLYNVLDQRLPTRVFLVLSQPRMSPTVQLKIHSHPRISVNGTAGRKGLQTVTVVLVDEPQEWNEGLEEDDGGEEGKGEWRSLGKRGAVFADDGQGLEFEEDDAEDEEWEEERRRMLWRGRAGGAGRDGGSVHRRRLLMDTFGSELRFVDALLRQRFGYRRRRVPAHMPHMIETEIMTEIQNIWSAEYAETSGQRFRTGNDMQMAFAYYSYLAEARSSFAVEDIIEQADGNRDGLISKEELYWIALRASKHGSRRPSRESALGLMWPILETHQRELAAGRPGISFSKVLKHMPLVDSLNSSISQQSARPRYRTVEADESLSRFIMLKNNISDSILELDNARVDRPSYIFLCLNDNLDEDKGDILPVLQEVRGLLAHLFPVPSPYELPDSGGYSGVRPPSVPSSPDVCSPWCTRALIVANCGFLLWLFWLAVSKSPKRRTVRRRILSAALYLMK